MSLERFEFFCRVANCFSVSGDAPCHGFQLFSVFGRDVACQTMHIE
jgi:hypothetical protein